ncbi:Oidioi.mRNA.OKI2018_I69.XSR.g16769.t1.cds [Oikopleura dioica]|uniref:Oidioi.mRNA.OKI2018_I69.XSR.g16769.t1.cds n=1 Tax=Oikopleura dioica TaxID=34765 RepID=A0ABN7SH70_OIKDI|nr:Oidioi.mRNA.OKI2018_I69.XSR.g16769.t1.cds [Oikopleura dioica]
MEGVHHAMEPSTVSTSSKLTVTSDISCDVASKMLAVRKEQMECDALVNPDRNRAPFRDRFAGRPRREKTDSDNIQFADDSSDGEDLARKMGRSFPCHLH